MSTEEPKGDREGAERRRRLREVFGEVLPEQTSDDTDAARPDRDGDRDDWFRQQVPPHHG